MIYHESPVMRLSCVVCLIYDSPAYVGEYIF